MWVVVQVMILLVDKVLPEGYFANNLRALSVDMAVFRDLLHSQLPQLSTHLLHLQTAARDLSTGTYWSFLHTSAPVRTGPSFGPQHWYVL